MPSRDFRPTKLGAEQTFDRLIELRPNRPILKVLKPGLVTFNKTGDVTGVRSAFEALPASMADDRTVLTYRLYYAFVDRDWPRAKSTHRATKWGRGKRAVELLPISEDAVPPLIR
jgi:hypothetical protein